MNILGIQLTAQLIAKLGIGILIAAALYFLYDKVNDHFQYIKDLEQINVDLKEDKELLEEQKDELLRINSENEATYRTQLEQAREAQRIAELERVKAVERARSYKEIRDEINSTPAADRRPVSPVIANTLGRLWGERSTDRTE